MEEIRMSLDMVLLNTKIKTLQNNIMDRIYYEKERMKNEKIEVKKVVTKIVALALVGFFIGITVIVNPSLVSEPEKEIVDLVNGMLKAAIICIVTLMSLYAVAIEYGKHNARVKKATSIEDLISQLEKAELVDHLCRNKETLRLLLETGSDNARKIRKDIKKLNKYQKLKRILLNSDTLFITVYDSDSKIKIAGDKWTEHVKFKLKDENKHYYAPHTHMGFGLSGFIIYLTAITASDTKREYKAYTRYILEDYNKKEVISQE